MNRLLPVGMALGLSACATTQAPAPVSSAPAPCPAPVTVPGNVVVRLFDGVLTLPAGYVFDGNALGKKTLFQGESGALRMGPRTELKTGYLDYARKRGGLGPEVRPSGNVRADSTNTEALNILHNRRDAINFAVSSGESPFGVRGTPNSSQNSARATRVEVSNCPYSFADINPRLVES